MTGQPEWFTWRRSAPAHPASQLPLEASRQVTESWHLPIGLSRVALQ
ncbi:MAG TPA: hypothetical protein QF753_22770 [Victivallales bacterium]|nr:hypothetical protein [Victivallales bacterium]